MTSPSGGAGANGVEVARGYATVVINDQTAAGLSSIQANSTRTVRQIQSTSQIARNSIQGIFQGLGTQITQTALGPLLNVGEGVARLNNQFETTGSKSLQMAQNVGAGLTSIGATMLLVGAKEKQSQDQLAQSIDNAGQSYGDYAQQIDAVITKQQSFGHTAVTVQNAMAILDNSTHDAQATIDDFGEVSDLAAAKHEDLNTAARQVAVTIGGGGRLFRQYNIEIQKNADGTTNYTAMNQQLANVLSGQASAAANNFGGSIRALGADLENTFAALSQKWAPAVTIFGVATEVVSSVLQIKYVSGLRAAAAAQDVATKSALAGKIAIEGESAAYTEQTVNMLASAAAIQKASVASTGGAVAGGASGAGSTTASTAATNSHRAAVEGDTEAEGRHAETVGTVTVAEIRETAALEANQAAAERTALAMRELGLSEESVVAVSGQVSAGQLSEAAAMQASRASAEATATANGEVGASSLSMAGTLGIVAGALTVALIADKALATQFQQHAATGTKAENVLLEIAKAGTITSQSLKDAGASGDSFNTILKNLKPSEAQQLGNLGSQFAPFSNDVSKASNAFKSFDAGLTAMAQGGEADQAAAAFKVIADEAQKQGYSLDYVLSKLPQYKELLDNATDAITDQQTVIAKMFNITPEGFADIVTAVGKTNTAYTAGESNIQAMILANDQLQSTLGLSDQAWLKLANDLARPAATNGGITGMSQQLRNTDESLQAVTSDFQPLTDAYSAWTTSVAAANAAEAQGDASVQSATESLQSARESAADTAVSGAESIKAAEKAVADQYVTDAKSIASAEDAITTAQRQALSAQRALDDARQTAADNLVKAQRELRDVGEDNDKAQIALDAAQLKASQDQVAAAQEALNNSTGLTQQQLIAQQNAINVQAAANAAEATKVAQEQSKYDVSDAQKNLSDTLADNAEAAKQAAATVQAGVDGAQSVLDAQQALADANKNVQDSVQNLADTKAKAAQDEQDQLAALTKARTSAAKANSDAAKQVQDAQKNLASAQATAQANTQAATAAEEANRLKLDELEIQTGQTDGSVNQISQDIQKADKSLDIAFSSTNELDTINSIIDVQRAIEQALLEAGGMSVANAQAQSARDNLYQVASVSEYTYRQQNGGHLAGGGPVNGPGGPLDDQVPLWGSDGEYMIKAAAVDQYGEDFMDAINSQKLATGGMVFDFNKMGIAQKMKSSSAFKPQLGSGVGMTGTPRQYAELIIDQARQMNLGYKGAEIGLITALTESGLKNYANSNIPSSLSIPHDAVGSDHYSLGLFQQQSGPFGSSWGTVSQVMDPTYATDKFFSRMVGVQNWQNKDPGVVAQTVQVSAYPDAYDRQLPSAQSLLSAIGYDEGGILPTGLSMTNNATGKPEAIFTHEQAQALAEMAKSGGGITIENLVLQLDPSTIKQVEDIINIFNQLPQKIRAASGASSTMRTG